MVRNGGKSLNAFLRVRWYAAGPVTGGGRWLRWVSSYNHQHTYTYTSHPSYQSSLHCPMCRHIMGGWSERDE